MRCFWPVPDMCFICSGELRGSLSYSLMSSIGLEGTELFDGMRNLMPFQRVDMLRTDLNVSGSNRKEKLFLFRKGYRTRNAPTTRG